MIWINTWKSWPQEASGVSNIWLVGWIWPIEPLDLAHWTFDCAHVHACIMVKQRGAVMGLGNFQLCPCCYCFFPLPLRQPPVAAWAQLLPGRELCQGWAARSHLHTASLAISSPPHPANSQLQHRRSNYGCSNLWYIIWFRGDLAQIGGWIAKSKSNQ